MATFAIESNGRIEKTAIYFNGQQLGGIKEVYLYIDEEGTFDTVIQYEGIDKVIYTKHIFNDFLENVKVVPPSFSEEEAQFLQLLEIVSNGDIDSTTVYINEQEQEGIVNLLVHIKASQKPSNLKKLFTASKIPDHAEFKAEITYRNEDGSLETEPIF